MAKAQELFDLIEKTEKPNKEELRAEWIDACEKFYAKVVEWLDKYDIKHEVCEHPDFKDKVRSEPFGKILGMEVKGKQFFLIPRYSTLIDGKEIGFKKVIKITDGNSMSMFRFRDGKWKHCENEEDLFEAMLSITHRSRGR